MRKNLLAHIFIVVLITSACGAKPSAGPPAPTQTEPPAATAPATQAPTATEAPPAETITATPETPIPTNIAGCTNSASFIADVTVADNEIIPAGSAVTKTWRVKNTGTCIWTPDYTLTYYSGDRIVANASVPLTVTYPDQTTDISIQLIAPDALGTYRSYFVIKNPAGLIMKVDKDSRLWVVINVTTAVASGPTATPGAGSIPVTGGGLATVTCTFTTDAARISAAIDAINAYRAENNLPAYTVNDLLAKAATAHANDMACNKLFAHVGSNDSTPATRVAASGYAASSVSENVYSSNPPLTGKGVVDWWKNDTTDTSHNLNLLSNTYTEIGVGYAFFENFGYYVLVFAKPQ